jgi:hypothetical protein
MSASSRCALSGALILVSVAAPAAAAAVPVTVNVRVEGATSTIFDGPVVTDGHNLSPPSGGGSRVCDGTNNGAFPTPGPTATAALDDAARTGGFSWDGTWFPDFSDFLVDRIATEQATSSQFWGHFVNGKSATAGGCQTRLQAGDETVWAFDAFGKTSILRLEGPGTATVGSPVNFRVIDTAPATSVPAVGAAVNGTPTGSDGVAMLTFPAEGIFSVKADRPDAVRSNSIRICVDPAGALPCSSTDTSGPTITFGAAGGQRGGLASERGRSRTMLITWAGDDQTGSGVSHYKAEVSQLGDGAGASQASWRTLIDRTTLNGVHFRGEAGDAYQFRITATDRALNETTVTTDPVIVPVDDRSQRLLKFSKRDWKRVRATNAWGGTVVRATKAGATARLRFNGTSLSLVGRTLPKGGRLRVTIDDKRTAVRLRGRSAHRGVLWTSRELEPGAHTLVLRTLGGGPVELDAVAPIP